MKTEPTDIDREAARLFVPAPGMRVMHHIARITRPASHVGPEECDCSLAWVRVVMSNRDGTRRSFAIEGNAKIGRRAAQIECSVVKATKWLDALDTDDPATVGCMLAQVEDAAGARVDMTWDWDWATRSFIEYVAHWQGDDCIGVARRGRTRGAALVAAMKAIKGAA